MADKYILNGHEPVEETDLLAWGRWLESAERIVKKDYIGTVLVSTVFLGLNHQFLPNLPPLLFETMVFGGELDREQRRYATWEEAERGHDHIVDQVRQNQR